MATPLTAATFELLARGAGIPLQEHDGWPTRNRGSRGTGWGPVQGVMIHHTVTKDLADTIALVIRGQSAEVPGPLYSGVISKTGVVHMVGWGRCNHAGLGDPEVLRDVIAERALSAPQHNTEDGNSRFYGFAMLNLGDGKDPYPAVQLAAAARVSAVICRHHGWKAASVIGHKDWQRGKIDPHGPAGYLMPGIRTAVGSLLRKK